MQLLVMTLHRKEIEDSKDLRFSKYILKLWKTLKNITRCKIYQTTRLALGLSCKKQFEWHLISDLPDSEYCFQLYHREAFWRRKFQAEFLVKKFSFFVPWEGTRMVRSYSDLQPNERPLRKCSQERTGVKQGSYKEFWWSRNVDSVEKKSLQGHCKPSQMRVNRRQKVQVEFLDK